MIKVVAIEGLVCAGKTTLLKELGQDPNIGIVPEYYDCLRPKEKVPSFPPPNKAGALRTARFLFELEKRRQKIARNLLENDKLIILDRCFMSCFAFEFAARKITGIDEIIIGTATTVRIHQDASGEVVFSDRDGKQASVGIGTTVSINTTGIVTAATLKASTAFYPPIYTTTQRDAGSFDEGAIIFNTTSKKMEFYDGTSWNTLPGLTVGLSLALDG